ncbi:hypothetical protein DLM75_23675 [Leptospira stimsonii]|uniref:Uncharacterized protein n=1 Tax=Leptospira stimsonii TaxID=2202203 RepID=A0A396YS30_9LEPT|nr:hypothetical protein DLM75_23675 [Leptospira stimsonii]
MIVYKVFVGVKFQCKSGNQSSPFGGCNLAVSSPDIVLMVQVEKYKLGIAFDGSGGHGTPDEDDEITSGEK